MSANDLVSISAITNNDIGGMDASDGCLFVLQAWLNVRQQLRLGTDRRRKSEIMFAPANILRLWNVTEGVHP